MNTMLTQSGETFKISRIWIPRSEKFKQQFPITDNVVVMLNSSEALLRLIGEKKNQLLIAKTATI